MTEEGLVTTAINEGVGEITFSHPAHNSLPGYLLKKLASAIQDAGENPAISVVVLKSGGERTFCAGASFNELIHIEDENNGKAFFMGFANVINACRKCPKVIIGRVQGKAVGGGVGLAAATDFCFATKYAQIKLSELSIGIGPFVVGPAVERKVGTSGFSQLAIDATNFKSAEWALQKGLFQEVSDSTELMDQAIASLTSVLVKSSPEAKAAIKKSVWEGTENWDQLLADRAAISGSLVLSAFTKKVLDNYKER